ADIVSEEVSHFGSETRVALRRGVGALDLQDQRHQGLGDEAAAVDSEMAALVGARAIGVDLAHGLKSKPMGPRTRSHCRMRQRYRIVQSESQPAAPGSGGSKRFRREASVGAVRSFLLHGSSSSHA